jgi:hypothetical protein
MESLEYFETAQAFYRNGEYEAALGTVADAEIAGKASVELLLLKGACIQLSTGTDFSIDRALQTYIGILKRRPDDPRVLAEIGFFNLKVADNPEGAKEPFEKAAEIYGRLLVEVLAGLIEVEQATGMSMNEAVASARNRIEKVVADIESRGASN